MSVPGGAAGRSPSGAAGYLLVAAAATSWGVQSVVAKLLLTSGLAASSLISTRTTLAAVLLLAVLAAGRPVLLRVTAADLGRLAVLGILGMALSNYTYYLTLTRIPVATAALLMYAAPLFVLAASVVALDQRLRRPDLLAAAMTLGGAALVVKAYQPTALRVNAVGLALGVFSAAAFAFFNLWAKTLPPRLSSWTMLTYAFVASAAFWASFAPPWTLLLEPHPRLVWAGIATVTAFGTLVPFALYLAGLKRISAAHASVTSGLEPVVSALVAFAVLDESLAWLQVAGGALILVGIGVLHVRH